MKAVFVLSAVMVWGLMAVKADDNPNDKLGQESGYYNRLVSLIATNDSVVRGITSPLLTDTNNLSAKVTNILAKLPRFKKTGEISDMHLGLTMEEVVARWGKPRWIWPRCYGGPRLCYSGASVILEPATNRVMTILVEYPWQSGGRFVSRSQVVSMLGEPAAPKGAERDRRLSYQTPVGVMELGFYEDGLISIRLDSHPR